MFREVQTFMGYCCQFDIPFFSQFDFNIIHRKGKDMVLPDVLSRIKIESLDIPDKITDSWYLYMLENCQKYPDKFPNYTLYLFDHSDSITLLDSSVTLTATTFYDVNVDVWAIDSSDNVKALSLD
ncbi:hypothetical protein ABMA28_015336, partial [Loxostege sticticalis]